MTVIYVGPSTYAKLVPQLGTEIEILYTVSLEAIAAQVGQIAQQIRALRLGQLSFVPGGGGKYGYVTKEK